MLIKEIIALLDAEVCTEPVDMEINIDSACGSDLMSDVMAFSKENTMMLTGLVNIQVIRTAEMMDMKVVAFVRGKKPTPEMIKLAQEKDIILIKTELPMFSACGILYTHSVKGRGVG